MNRVHVEDLGYMGMRLMAVYIFQHRNDEVWIQRQESGKHPTYAFHVKAGELAERKPLIIENKHEVRS